MMQKQDLWGLVSDESGTTTIECKFEDSFSPESLSPHSQEEDYVADEDYVPLEDSPQYLAGLERKLARVQGRTAGRRQTESRRLIDALAGSRDTHAHQLINTNTIDRDETIAPESELVLQSAAVDPQGAFGAMLRRLAPDKIALTHEELCQLLEADFLANVQEEAAAAAAAKEEAEERRNEETKSDSMNDNDRVKSDQPSESVYTLDEKKLSSDEGEK